MIKYLHQVSLLATSLIVSLISSPHTLDHQTKLNPTSQAIWIPPRHNSQNSPVNQTLVTNHQSDQINSDTKTKHRQPPNRPQPTPKPKKRRIKVSPTPTTLPTPTPIISPTPNPPAGNIQPYAQAPKCPDHDKTIWHGIWDFQRGCHYNHEHKMNPHDMDDVFGADIYEWFGGEISYPWQTYAGANDSFESYIPGTCTENDCKHEGYHYLYFKNRTSPENIRGALILGSHVITDARVKYHQVGGQVGALTRFHSLFVEARSCYAGAIPNNNPVNETCGTYQGGGWADLGRLNYPQRGTYQPLPNDDPDFGNFDIAGVPEAAPYRIHSLGKNSLDSWQTEGNFFNYLPNDPQGDYRIKVGYGIHFPQGESIGETNPQAYGAQDAIPHFWCKEEDSNLLTCSNNNSAAALFRTWVSIPQHLDGSSYDTDGHQDGFFSFNGYTNRYGDIVEGCQSVGLDCVPAKAVHFPVGGCKSQSCKSAYRGSVSQDYYDADISPEGVWWIEYPN